MTFWLDAQLPPSLAAWVSKTFGMVGEWRIALRASALRVPMGLIGGGGVSVVDAVWRNPSMVPPYVIG